MLCIVDLELWFGVVLFSVVVVVVMVELCLDSLGVWFGVVLCSIVRSLGVVFDGIV